MRSPDEEDLLNNDCSEILRPQVNHSAPTEQDTIVFTDISHIHNCKDMSIQDMPRKLKFNAIMDDIEDQENNYNVAT